MFCYVRGKIVDQYQERFWIGRKVTIRVERAYYGRIKTYPDVIDFKPEF